MVRAARNQALYRHVNERLRDVNEVFDEFAALSGGWVCECCDAECIEMMEMTLAEYEALRGHPHRFAVICGHENANIELTVEEHGGWVVVEKFGVGAAVAIEHDPRCAAAAA
jgi:hypothetical protein